MENQEQKIQHNETNQRETKRPWRCENTPWLRRELAAPTICLWALNPKERGEKPEETKTPQETRQPGSWFGHR